MPLDLILIGLTGVTLLVPLIWKQQKSDLDPFEPLVLFAVAYGVMFFARPLEMVINHDYIYEAPLSVINIAPGFTKMLVLALLGAISFVTGYMSPLGKRLARPDIRQIELDARTAAMSAGVVAVIAALCFGAFLIHSGGLHAVLLLFRGRTPQLTHAVNSLSLYPWAGTLMLIPASLMFLALAWARKSILLVAAFALTATLILLRALPEGHRFTLLVFAGAVFAYSYLRRLARPSWLFLLVLSAVALIAGTLLSDLRGRSTRGESVRETFVQLARHPQSVPDRLVSGPDSEMAPVLAAAVNVIPAELTYTYGDTIFGDLLVRPIPRVLWHAKPKPPRDKLISTLWPAESAEGSVNMEFSVLLYFYWDFGMIGVVLGLALLGAGGRWLYEYFQARAESLSAQLLYATSVWFTVIGLRNSPVDTFISGIFLVGPLLVILHFARRPLPLSYPAYAGCDSTLT